MSNLPGNDDLFPNKEEFISIEDEMRKAYLDYSMSVIVGRALPDVRDGLKPVHRRIIYAMHEQSNYWNRSYKKSARIVGDVIGKYHPHGDSAVYDALVRLAQPFAMRYTLVDGQGNFGSIDGDSPAAMRYTEVRMRKITDEIISDLDKDTVDFELNYDDTEKMPSVMPTKVPNLLINGASGIAVGMATNIPPHNLSEVLSACLALLRNEDITIKELIEHIPGPDFPTAGIISGRHGMVNAYHTGRGRVVIHAKYHIETKGERNSIIITEIPYQVNKARLLERIASLVKEKEVEGISELRDESNSDGIRVVIEVKRGEVPEVIYNNLLINSPLRTYFGINMVAIIDGQPKLLNLKQILESFIRHRREVVSRRAIFELNKSKNQAHILEGLTVAISNIDPIIATIKASRSQQEAKEKLISTLWRAGAVMQMVSLVDPNSIRPRKMEYSNYGLKGENYQLSETQAQAILELRLQRLTGMEQEKILSDYKSLLEIIKDLLDILSSPDRLTQIIEDELIAVRDQFGDTRNTIIEDEVGEISDLDLIAKQTVAVTLSREGYMKSQGVDSFRAQRRGGRGKAASSLKDEDIIEQMLITDNHSTLLCFSNLGKVYWLRVVDVPFSSTAARGRPIVNLLKVDEGEKITTILPLSKGTEAELENTFIMMVTTKGTIKRTTMAQFSRPRSAGLIAISLNDGDQLVDAIVTDGQQEVMLFGSSGYVNRFKEDNVRSMGRAAAGVRGIRLKDNEKVVGMMTAISDSFIITICENGFGKASPVDDFPIANRGTRGVIGIKTSDRNGDLVRARVLTDEEEMLLISHNGVLIRIATEGVPKQSRNTQGVRLMNLDDKDYVTEFSLLKKEVEDDGDQGEQQELE